MKQKQNQSLYRPFPGENPAIKKQDELCLNSNCRCEVCRSDLEPLNPQIKLDQQLYQLKSLGMKNKFKSDYIYFLDEMYKHHGKTIINFPILDTIIFTSEGSVKYIVHQEGSKLKMEKLPMSLRAFMAERKWLNDLEYQKKKYQRNNSGFQFTQLDHQSEKLIKEFQNNIKFMNSLLNRVAIAKERNKESEQVLSQNELNTIFSRVARKILDFSDYEYMKIFPIMCGEEENSYIKKVKYFRKQEREKKNYKLAEHYISYWFNRNETLEKMEQEFLAKLKEDEEEYIMYLTYKLFIYFQKISNKEVQSAIVEYTTNDKGHSFILSNVQSLRVSTLLQVGERIGERPQKLVDYEVEDYIDLKDEMKKKYNHFQFQYNRLETERLKMQNKLQKDIEFSNWVYESVVNRKLEKDEDGQEICFIKQVFSSQNSIDLETLRPKQKVGKKKLNLIK